MTPCEPSMKPSTAPSSPTPTCPSSGGVRWGYAAYDLIRCYERLPSLKPDLLGIPDLLFVEPEVVVVFDQFKQQLHIVAPATEGKKAQALERIAWAEKKLHGPLPGVPGERAGRRMTFSQNLSQAEYEAMVAKALEYIRAGDIFQVVPSLRMSAPLNVHLLRSTVPCARSIPAPIWVFWIWAK